MNYKNILSILGFLFFGVGIVMAISGASPTQVGAQTRWAGNAAASLTTEGGNITAANVAAETLTDKWADFYGNISGNISLRDSGSRVYTWTWSPASGGEVCLSTASAFAFSPISGSSAVAANTQLAFGTASDNFTNTYNATCDSDLSFAQSSVTAATSAAAKLQGSSGFTDCAINTTVTSSKDDYAFCTHINSTGTAYNGASSHYEIMVPTTFSPSATDTYFFYAELN